MASLNLDVKDDDKIIIPKKDKDTAIEDHSSNVNHIKWVCSENRSYLFDQPTEDYFCPFDPPFHGILSSEEFGQETKLHSNRSNKQPDSKG